MSGNVVRLRPRGFGGHSAEKPNVAKAGDDLRERCLADFKRSGIDAATVAKLDVEFCDADAVWNLLYPKRRDERPAKFTVEGWAIHYRTPDGRPLNHVRVRALSGTWLDGTSYEKRRYGNRANSLPHLYTPLGNWPRGKDGRIRVPRLVVSEGEKKVIKAMLCGIDAVGLGGVDSFGSAKHEVAVLEEFSAFDVSDTVIEVCFDSDVYNNAEARSGLLRLCYQLRAKLKPKALRVVRLTSESSDKTALDDFLCQFPDAPSALEAWDALPRTDDPVQEAFALFNAELVQVRRKQTFYNLSHDTFYRSLQNVVQEYGVGDPVRTRDGKGLALPIRLWVTERDPAITTVTDVVYEPGKPPRFRASPGEKYDTLNSWRPGPFTFKPPKQSRAAHREATKDAQPFIDFIEYLSRSLDQQQRGILLDWCAYPLQNVGAKMDFAVVVVSESHGTGKNTLGRILRECYGAWNVGDLKGSTLAGRFNDWSQKQLVVVSEIRAATYPERAALMEDLKTLITEDRIDLNRKFLPQENVPNHANLYLTSNHFDALTLTQDDRRFFVIRAPDKDKKWTKDEFIAFNAWLASGGYEAVYRFLMTRPLANFKPHMDAPATVARRLMIRGSYNVIDDIVELLFEDPEEVIQFGSNKVAGERRQDLFTPQELTRLVTSYAERNNKALRPLSTATLGASMRKFRFAKKSFVVVSASGERRHHTLYAIFSADKWRGCDGAEWRKEWRAIRKRLARKRQEYLESKS